MANRLHLSKMREGRRALSVRQASIRRLKVPRLPCQCVAHGNHGYEIQPHAIICVVLGRVPCDNADARAICSSIPKTTLATKRRFNCSTNSAPVWCDRSATLSAINIRLKWMKRLWVGGQKAKDAVFTTKQQSLEPLRCVCDGPPPSARSRKG